MKPYKSIQSKALHKGAYIKWAFDEKAGEVWTTNGQVAINRQIYPDEVKAIKGQYEGRGDDLLEFTSVINNLKSLSNEDVQRATIREEETVDGLQLTVVVTKDFTVKVQSIYVDYVNAVFDGSWYASEKAVFMAEPGRILAIIAPVITPVTKDK